MINTSLMQKTASSRKYRWQWRSKILSLAGGVLGLLSLLGHLFSSSNYAGKLSWLTSLQVSAAIALVVIAVCLLCLHQDYKITGRLGLIIILLFTSLNLAGHFREPAWGIGNWLLANTTAEGADILSGPTSVLATLNLMVLTIALLAISFGRFSLGQLLAAFLFTLAYASIIGNLYNIDGFYAEEHFSGISTLMALAVALLSLGILLYCPDRGWMKMVASKYSGGMLARYAFTYFLLVAPIFIGFYMYSLNEWDLTPGLGILSLFILTCLITLPIIYYFLQRFNTLDSRLQKAHHKLQIANTGLLTRNQELTEALADVKAGNRELAVMTKEVLLGSQALESKNKELSRLNQSLDYIVQMTSHDLKTPVYNLELLLKEIRPALEPYIQPREALLITKVDNSISSLKSTIEGLTQIIKSQQLIIGLQVAFSLTKLIQEITKELEREIQQGNAEIHKNLEVDNVIFSRIHLRSVLFNLFSNALKYRAPDRPLRINICSRPAPGGLEIKFADNGLGMSEYQVANLFTIYNRFHPHVEGSGIGLYLVKQTIENNGGTIRAKSTEGAGTCFIIFLPQVKK